jgi:hypothetical protein
MTTQQDRYGFLNNILLSRGKIMYWDYQGHLAVKTQPLDSPAPVWDVTAGPGGVIVSGERRINRDGVYNMVVVTSDGADTTAAPLAIAYDANPDSPTYWQGPFGQVPQFYSDPSVTTQGQAAAAASVMLAKSVQLPFQVTFTAVPNPAAETYDVVRVSYGSGAPDELHIIDTLTIPLNASDPLSGTAHDPAKLMIGVSVVQ